MPYALGGLLARWTMVLRQWRDSPAAEAAFQAHAPMQFYDTWVARDAEGGLLEKHAPFARRASAALPTACNCALLHILKEGKSLHALVAQDRAHRAAGEVTGPRQLCCTTPNAYHT